MTFRHVENWSTRAVHLFLSARTPREITIRRKIYFKILFYALWHGIFARQFICNFPTRPFENRIFTAQQDYIIMTRYKVFSLIFCLLCRFTGRFEIRLRRRCPSRSATRLPVTVFSHMAMNCSCAQVDCSRCIKKKSYWNTSGDR